jgi:hypothetical protein
MKLLWLIISLGCLIVLVSGCASWTTGQAKNPISRAISNLTTGPSQSQESPDVVIVPAYISQVSEPLNRYGVALIAIGLIFGALTRFRSGWGLSFAAAGVLMVLFAWTWEQWWAPYLGVSTILSFAIYKAYNFLNPSVKTEPILL